MKLSSSLCIAAFSASCPCPRRKKSTCQSGLSLLKSSYMGLPLTSPQAEPGLMARSLSLSLSKGVCKSDVFFFCFVFPSLYNREKQGGRGLWVAFGWPVYRALHWTPLYPVLGVWRAYFLGLSCVLQWIIEQFTWKYTAQSYWVHGWCSEIPP